MEIVTGECRVTQDAGGLEKAYAADSRFDVPANSGFQIRVASGICEYICSFLA
jgi:hypothetical protein